ncbi:hypothetical protein [Kordiimonas sp. SCSIO 12610]|uniref:hypothetical protein n=1 Tax=Kordiimonas sp. SCSIO 12610 TaxID=2829597 RepID=UPI002108A03D|nr:hypothetical protein [Kordiimonas sp. SCSIO 12610]UTW56148.1 hypothetical protein KFF44_04430 [Kordiimonas sp. SCSIO 12610]
MATDKDRNTNPPLPSPYSVQSALCRTTRRLRAASVRRIWRQSKALASTFSTKEIEIMQAAWFLDRFGPELSASETDSRPPNSGFARNRFVRNILWLIEVREGYLARHNTNAVIRVNAAIWHNIMALKFAIKRLPHSRDWRNWHQSQHALLQTQNVATQKPSPVATNKTEQHNSEPCSNASVQNTLSPCQLPREQGHYDAPHNQTSQLVATPSSHRKTGYRRQLYSGRLDEPLCREPALDLRV